MAVQLTGSTYTAQINSGAGSSWAGQKYFLGEVIFAINGDGTSAMVSGRYAALRDAMNYYFGFDVVGVYDGANPITSVQLWSNSNITGKVRLIKIG